MGYNTDYKLEIEGTEYLNPIEEYDLRKDICELLSLQPKSDISLIYFEGKYYQIQPELKKLAKKYPTLVFDLSGDGEDRDDRWRLAVKGNKSCYKKAEPVKIEISLDELS